MNPRTLGALKASIKHWEENVAAETPDKATTGPFECALCKLYWRDGCHGCPVRDATHKKDCDGSPYVEADNALDRWHDDPAEMILKTEWRKAAQAELDFLRSLLPGEPS